MVIAVLIGLSFGMLVVAWSRFRAARRTPMLPGKPEVHSLLDADAARAGAPVAVAAPVVVVVDRAVPAGRPPVRLMHRVGASLIGMFCLTFGVLAVVLVVRGVRHPVVFITALVMLSAAADFLPAVFTGRRPYLGWFFP